MADRPILFSAPMVRAILAGTKTQTRRAIKPLPLRVNHSTSAMEVDTEAMTDGRIMKFNRFGQPGDRLWVRENGWERPERTPRMLREGADTWERYYFDADGLTEQDAADFKAWGFKRRPSIHMPRWASRITLEVTGVRVEQLQDISHKDAMAEGVSEIPEHFPLGPKRMTLAQHAYAHLWDSINGPGSWSTNPWVWLVEFKKLEEPTP